MRFSVVLIALSVALFCALLNTAPDWVPKLTAGDDAEWSPVNSFNMRHGDSYYYAAWTREAASGDFPLRSPSARELADTNLLETVRSAPIYLAALPGLVTSDIRWIYVGGYAMSAAGIFLMMFWLACRLVGDWRYAIFAGFALLYFSEAYWSSAPNFPTGLTAGDLFDWVYAVLVGRPRASVVLASDFDDVDFLGSVFRYVNISISILILIAYFFIIEYINNNNRNRFVSVLFVLMSPVFLFSYSSHALVAYSCVAMWFVLSFVREQRMNCWIAAAGLVATLIVAVAVGYVDLYKAAYVDGELWKNIFQKESIEFVGGWMVCAKILLINKYMFSFVLLYVMTRKSREINDLVIIVGVVAVLLAGVRIFNTPQLWDRFQGRGIDFLWFAVILVGIGHWWRRLEFNGKAASRAKVAVSVLLFVAVTVAPVTGFAKLTWRTSHDGSRLVPADVYRVYAWVGRNFAKNANILSVDWDDITFLPIYTDVNLSVGHNVIDGRAPDAELRRYVAASKVLGVSRERLLDLVAAGPEGVRLRTEVARRRKPPFAAEQVYDAAMVMEGAIYWPYVNRVAGIKVTDNRFDYTVNPEFLRYVSTLYDHADPRSFIEKDAVDGIVFSPQKGQRVNDGVAALFDEVFRNDARVVLKRRRR